MVIYLNHVHQIVINMYWVYIPQMKLILCFLLFLPTVFCSSSFSVSALNARKHSRGSRTWVSSKSLVVLESEESEEDHIDKHGYELCDAIGYGSSEKVLSDNLLFHIWSFVFCHFTKQSSPGPV